MKLFLSFAAFAVAASAAAIPVSASVDAATPSGLRKNLSRNLASNPDNNEICFRGPKNYSQEDVTLLASLATYMADESFHGVTPSGGATPHYTLGCGFLDFKCYACDLCKEIYGALVNTGSEVACDAACIGIAEAAGGGPEDPVADIVAAACVPLCQAIFSAVGGGTAQSVCKVAHLCK